MWTLTTATTSGNFSEQRILVPIVFLHTQCQYSLGSQYTPLNLIKNHDWFSVFFYTSECGCLVYGLGDDCFFHHMQHPIVEVGILHVLQSGLSPESTPLSANGGILGKDARVHTKVQHLSFEYFTSRGVTLAGAKAANRV